MSDGTLPTHAAAVPQPGASGTPVPGAVAVAGIYAASAIGALVLGLTDFLRHGTGSTVVALNNGLSALDPRVSLVSVILLMMPVMGLIVAWIFQPTTKRDAFALGLAVFSVLAVVPEEPSKDGVVDEIGVSSPDEEKVSLGLVARAHAAKATGITVRTTVLLAYDGKPSSRTEVSVRNLTADRWIGSYRVRDSIDLVGMIGDRVRIAIEAPGFERIAVELSLDGGTHPVELRRSKTPLFIQRLKPVARTIDIPNDPNVMRAVEGPVERPVQ
jgi:hypothetical protein